MRDRPCGTPGKDRPGGYGRRVTDPRQPEAARQQRVGWFEILYDLVITFATVALSCVGSYRAVRHDRARRCGAVDRPVAAAPTPG